MDIMKMKLTTKLMRGLVSKLIAKAVYSKFGYKIDVQLDEFSISAIDGEVTISTKVEAKMETGEFIDIVQGIGSYD